MMFENLVELARELRGEALSLYWILLVPIVVLLIIFELVKSEQQQPNAHEILKRSVISMLLLYSFDMTVGAISLVGEGILGRFDSYNNSWEVIKQLGPKAGDSDVAMFDIKGHILYVFALLSYIIAYLGFFLAEAMTHIVWLVLNILSPLMILCYIPKAMVSITVNLYKTLITVVIWKILWVILGALLLKLASEHKLDSIVEFELSIVVSLCIGLAMLFVPLVTKSLISSGFESIATAASLVPAFMASKFLKAHSMGLSRSIGNKTANFSGHQVRHGLERIYQRTNKLRTGTKMNDTNRHR